MFSHGLNLIKVLFFTFLLFYGITTMIRGFDYLKKYSYKNINIKNNGLNKNLSDIKPKIEEITKNSQKNIIVIEAPKKIEKEIKDTHNIITIIVKKGETFSKIIDPFFNSNQKNSIIKEIAKKFDLKYLKVNQKIFFFKNKKNEKIEKIILPISFDKDLVISIKLNKISAKEEKIEIVKEVNSIKFTISTSLYEDGINAGMPLAIIADAIRLYSFDIDFQRDIKKGTKFEVLYDLLINSKRRNIQYGNIQYINLTIEDKNLEYFIFRTNEGYDDYFNIEGKNVKKSLLKTPIDGARLSSNFGMRKHPISGYNKLHKGVDFAAPKGTPIYAGGNGVVEYLGYNGGYGKYIRLRHNNEYKTAYAHLSGYKKGIYKGKRVNQGDIIGYVGSTGKSTGPHLHYEIIYKNKQINPMKLKLPSGKVLEGSELKKFKKSAKEIYAKHLFVLYE